MAALKMLSSFLLISFFITLSSAQIFGAGSCPKVNVTANFSLENFLGEWYEIQAYPYFYTLGSGCVKWNFIQAENETISLQVSESRFGLDQFDIGKIEIVRPGVLLVSHPDSVVPRANADYYIMATDYNNYAVIYTCSHAFFFRAQNAWILSRKSVLEDSVLEEARAAMRSQGVSPSFLGITLQTCGSSSTTSL